MTDAPIAHTKDGKPIYDNTPTVCCVSVRGQVRGEDGEIREGILAIRRAHEPGKGLLGLPGGYHMRGETWQTGLTREVFEETGNVVGEEGITVRGLVTDKYGNNVILCTSEDQATLDPDAVLDGEASEIVVLDEALLRPEEWAFPLHFAIAHMHHSKAYEPLFLEEDGDRYIQDRFEVKENTLAEESFEP